MAALVNEPPMPRKSPATGSIAMGSIKDLPDFILNSLSSFTIGDLCIAILGYVPYIGPAFSTLSNITSIVNASIANKIKAAGGYTQITNIAIRVGNQPGTNGMSTVEGWTTHTKYTTPSNASNEKVTFFPAYNG